MCIAMWLRALCVLEPTNVSSQSRRLFLSCKGWVSNVQSQSYTVCINSLKCMGDRFTTVGHGRGSIKSQRLNEGQRGVPVCQLVASSCNLYCSILHSLCYMALLPLKPSLPSQLYAGHLLRYFWHWIPGSAVDRRRVTVLGSLVPLDDQSDQQHKDCAWVGRWPRPWKDGGSLAVALR